MQNQFVKEIDSADAKRVIYLNNPRAVYNDYVGYPLIGIFNVENNSIMLFPAYKDRVQLFVNDSGDIYAGNKLQKPHSIALTAEELEYYKRVQFAPRELEFPIESINPLSESNVITAHEYVVELAEIKDKKTLAKLRGFTVTRETVDSKPTFEWKSGSLNSPRDANGKSTHIPHCEMDKVSQTKVMDIIQQWSIPVINNPHATAASTSIIAPSTSNASIASMNIFQQPQIETPKVEAYCTPSSICVIS